MTVKPWVKENVGDAKHACRRSDNNEARMVHLQQHFDFVGVLLRGNEYSKGRQISNLSVEGKMEGTASQENVLSADLLSSLEIHSHAFGGVVVGWLVGGDPGDRLN